MISREERFHLADEPTSARVIRQQSNLLASAGLSENDKRDAKRRRKEARPEDHREEGGEG
jgi:hypothetical protein